MCAHSAPERIFKHGDGGHTGGQAPAFHFNPLTSLAGQSAVAAAPAVRQPHLARHTSKSEPESVQGRAGLRMSRLSDVVPLNQMIGIRLLHPIQRSRLASTASTALVVASVDPSGNMVALGPAGSRGETDAFIPQGELRPCRIPSIQRRAVSGLEQRSRSEVQRAS
jgi:hypothetical protein